VSNTSSPLLHLDVRDIESADDASVEDVSKALSELSKVDLSALRLERLVLPIFPVIQTNTDERKSLCLQMAKSLAPILQNLPTLKTCCLMNGKLPEANAILNAAMSKSTSLIEVLSGKSSGSDAAMAEIVSNLKTLKSIQYVGASKTLAAVADAISRGECQIETLHLPKTTLDTADVSKLFGAICSHGCPSLKSIDMYRCEIGTNAAANIAAAISSPTCAITFLNLGGNAFDLKGLLSIMRALATNSSIERLLFEYGAGKIDKTSHPQVLKVIGDSMKTNSTLRSMVISLTGVAKINVDRFAETIAEHNKTLIGFSIEMWGNDLLDKLIEVLKRNRDILKESLAEKK
jgi:hypothetical protein